MRVWELIAAAIPAMVGSAAAAYTLTPQPAAEDVATAGDPSSDDPQPLGDAPGGTAVPKNPANFVDDGAVKVDARLGHAAAPRGDRTETFVLVELRGSKAKEGSSPPAHLGLVIDKSGSMQGRRFENAKASARAALARLADGDTLSLVAFDTKPEVVVPPTVVTASTRASIERRIDDLRTGGDTCISCGIEAMDALMASSAGTTRRMVVLSDGDATAGLRKPDELRALTRASRAGGVTVSGIGMDVQYNERVLAAVAEGGEGQHRFVGQPSDLAAVFEREATSLRSTVAEDVEARLTLEPGVELLEVVDRTFTRSGSDVVVSVGSLSADEVKTVLCRVRLPPASRGDVLDVAGVSVRYRDLGAPDSKAVEAKGSLGARAAEAQGPPDPFVFARVERTQTAAALDEANALFRRGRVDEARRRIESQHAELAKNRRKFAIPPGDLAAALRASEATKDVDAQIATLDRANKGFATPPPAPVAAPGGAPQPKPTTKPAKPDMASPFESNARQMQEDSFNARR